MSDFRENERRYFDILHFLKSDRHTRRILNSVESGSAISAFPRAGNSDTNPAKEFAHAYKIPILGE